MPKEVDDPTRSTGSPGRSISAPLSLWKQAIPVTLSHSARFTVPPCCPSHTRSKACTRVLSDGKLQGAFSDKWHCLICGTHQSGRGGVANRHHAVNRALCETAWTLGEAEEVRGLLPEQIASRSAHDIPWRVSSVGCEDQSSASTILPNAGSRRSTTVHLQCQLEQEQEV